MSDGQSFLAFCAGLLAFALLVTGLMVCAFEANQCDWSIAVWKAHRRRKRLVRERAAAYLDMGYTLEIAKAKASNDLAFEAQANERALEALSR